MSYIPLPDKEGWCVEGYYSDKRGIISKFYLKSEIETKEDAKRQFLIDTLTKEKDFNKIDVLECIM